MFRDSFLCLVLLALSLCKLAHADQGLFINHRSAHPITALMGLPAPATRSDDSHVQLSLEHSNVFMGGGSSTEQLQLDGETTALHIRLGKRLNSCWQTDAALVFLSHDGGFLDRPIEDWHEVFGLPNASRDQSDRNQLEYAYESDGSVLRQVSSNARGFGEVHLSAQRYRSCQPGSSLWRVGAKLGTAADDSFFGSGATDFYIDWQSSRRKLSKRFDGVLTAGVLLPAQANNLPKQQAVVGFGSLGTEYRWSNSGSIVAQLDWHTPIFDSDLEELGRIAGQLTLAARKKSKRGSVFEVSFSEDIVTDTAPDFSVRLAWRQAWR